MTERDRWRGPIPRDEDEITVRTQLARLEERSAERDKALRERLDARTSESLRRHDQHNEADEKAFQRVEGALGDVASEMRAEFKQVRESIANLSKAASATDARVVILVGVATAVGSAIVQAISHAVGGGS